MKTVPVDSPPNVTQEDDEFPCDVCGARCTNMGDLERHITTTYHHQDALSKDLGSQIFWPIAYCTLKVIKNYSFTSGGVNGTTICMINDGIRQKD